MSGYGFLLEQILAHLHIEFKQIYSKWLTKSYPHNLPKTPSEKHEPDTHLYGAP